MGPVLRPGQALYNLREAWAYIARDNCLAADIQITRILTAVEGLARLPAMGRIGRRNGTRELVVARTHYIVACKPLDDVIEILAVMHP
jgi:plasmid stabilization system protein ParE